MPSAPVCIMKNETVLEYLFGKMSRKALTVREFEPPWGKRKGAVKEPNVHSRPHYNFISSKPMKEKNA